MDWASFIMALLDKLIECIQDRRKEEVAAELMSGSIFVRRQACQLLREQGFRGRELRRQTDEAMAYLADQDAEDIECLLEDAIAHEVASR